MKNLYPLVMKNLRYQSQTLEGTIMDVSIISLLEKFFFFMASSEIIPFSVRYFFVEVFISTFPTQDLVPSCKGTLWKMCAEHFSPKNKLATIKFDQLHQG